MSAVQPRIPVRYVGQQRHWKDTTYGSGVGFTKGKVSQVPAWAASQLLKHPEFEDARPAKDRGTIQADRPRDPSEDEELQQIQSHVRLDTMTREQMVTHAMRSYGVKLDPSAIKADITAAVVNLARARGG